MYETLEDIQALLGIACESHELEFKRGDELDAIDQNKVRDELVRDVSAFANAGGGTIIYGIAEDKRSPACAEKIHPVSNDKVTDIRVTQIIKNGLEPTFGRFFIRQIKVPDGGSIFVITVERADTAHQCKSDQRYYHRVGPSRPPMFDYEIRDVMNRRTAPVVKVHHAIQVIEQKAEKHVYAVIPTLINEGGLTARYWALDVIVPNAGAIVTQPVELVVEKNRIPDYPGHHHVFEYSYDRTATRRPAVLLPGQSLALAGRNGYGEVRLTITEERHNAMSKVQAPIMYRLYVDDCRMQEFVVPYRGWCTF